MQILEADNTKKKTYKGFNSMEKGCLLVTKLLKV